MTDRDLAFGFWRDHLDVIRLPRSGRFLDRYNV